MKLKFRVSRETLTTVFEVVGAGLVTAGVNVLFGSGVALIVGGLGVMLFSFLAASE